MEDGFRELARKADDLVDGVPPATRSDVSTTTPKQTSVEPGAGTGAGSADIGQQAAWNDPSLTADVAVDLYKAAGVKKPLAEPAVRDLFEKGYRFDPASRRWKKPHKPPSVRAPRAPTGPFFRDALDKITDRTRTSPHPLQNLVAAEQGPGGEITYDWHKTTRVTESGKTQTGRYPGSETHPIVQAGHPDAYASGAPQQYMLEDADLNVPFGGDVIESKGAFSFKVAVEVEGVMVDLASLQQWERLGVVPPGTVARALKGR